MELCNNKFMLIPEQEIVRAFTFIIPGIGNSWLDIYNGRPLEVSVSYNKKDSFLMINDKFTYNVKLFRQMFREKEINENEIKEISKSLKSISSASDKIVTNTKTIADKLKK